MRLLYFNSSGRLTSADFSRSTIPPYAILSHTWSDDEFLFEDLVNDTGKSKAGYEKVLFCGEQAARDHLQYFWIDTCCIDKWNLPELSYSINSMFRWYKNAAQCYAFLSDVSTPLTDAWEASFQKSRWFTRGWTLQELLAPASIDFFSSERQRIGDKASLEQQICEITRIPVTALRGDPLDEFSVPERMAWMIGRQTTQEEDMAYSLIGIFGVSMDFRYGEGKERALNRLQEEMEKANTIPFIVPFDQNAQFVGREFQLAELERTLFVGTSTTKVAITGPGGVGKTQLALALAYRVRQELKTCSVFWVSARDKESIHQAYAHIARRLTISGWDNEKVDVKKLVQLHLGKESAGQWLLIFDNADVHRLESAGLHLIEYLPSSKQGTIVFTTTDRKTAAKLAPQNIVELPEMEQEMAQKMLEMCLAYPANEQEKADLLLKELAYLPLAIVQAAAYVNVNKITLQEYLSLVVEQKEKVEVIGPINEEYENVIATTWFISFEQICRRDTLAADYLLFMACVDRNDVPLALLPAASPRDKGLSAVGTLNAYSFITKRTAESALDLHRLVHVSTRSWLEKKGLLSQQTQAAIARLLEVFPDHNHQGSRSKWRRLLPHAKYALSSGPTGQENEDGAKTKLAWKCGMTLLSDGRFNEAAAYFQEAEHTCRRILGDEHPSTLTSMHNLASTYRGQGRWEEAEKLFVQVMETRKRVLGAEHPDTLSSVNDLSVTYKHQGRWKEAEKKDVQVMQTSSRVLGAEHSSTVASMNNLATTYKYRGRWKEAEELFVQVMETRKRVLGAEHPDTLISIANLATTYRSLGRWKEAEELFVEVMETSSRVLGAEHPDTLSSVNDLSVTYKRQGRWKEAEELEVQVMGTRKRVFGAEHPDTLISIANLASIYRNQGRWKEAEEMEVKVLKTRKRVLGAEHPDTLTSSNELAVTYKHLGRWKEAEGLEVQVIEASLRVLGAEHPDTLISMGNLAMTYKNLGRWKEAEELEVQVVETKKRVLGAEHPDTLISMNNLASTYRNQGRWKEAEELYVQVMETSSRVLGAEHPSTVNVKVNLALTFKAQGRDREALLLMEKYLNVQ